MSYIDVRPATNHLSRAAKSAGDFSRVTARRACESCHGITHRAQSFSSEVVARLKGHNARLPPSAHGATSILRSAPRYRSADDWSRDDTRRIVSGVRRCSRWLDVAVA
ncbi:hypothetical protein PUN28_014972 [Cardiocondyla obscurior]|uniref:Cytochrome c domain-containing protein n=1 Tax=Cardiocondyla obscurior TaxID=286306 RepID=A0AAW2EXK7_9HYME